MTRVRCPLSPCNTRGPTKQGVVRTCRLPARQTPIHVLHPQLELLRLGIRDRPRGLASARDECLPGSLLRPWAYEKMQPCRLPWFARGTVHFRDRRPALFSGAAITISKWREGQGTDTAAVYMS